MAVLFDLDGTILGAKRNKHEIRNEATQEAGVDEIGDEEYYGTINEVLDDNKIENRVPIFKEILNDEDKAERLASIYHEKSLDNAYVYPDALEALKEIDAKKGLITDGPADVQRDKIDSFGLEKYFDNIVISGEVGLSKPNKEIFDYALEKLDSNQSNSLYVGNVPQLDVKGAKNAGLLSVVREEDGSDLPIKESNYQPDYTIRDMTELLDIIDKEGIE